MHFDWSAITQNLPQLLDGLQSTILLVVVSLACGSLIGMAACLGKLLGRGVTVQICSAYVAVFRGVPEMVMMFWIYYCGPLLGGVKPSSIVAALVSMSLYAGALLTEVFRGGVQAVPRGQVEAARALGIPEYWVWIKVIVPQAFRIVIPALIGVASLIVKVSGIASSIGVAELFYQANIAASESFRYFELFTAVGAFYFAVLFPMSLVAKFYEHKLAARTR